MQIETMLALQSSLQKDDSQADQLQQTDLMHLILKINQDVNRHGLCELEDYESKTARFPLLDRGLKLVRGGAEPQVVASALLHMAFANHIALLESLLVIEGVCSIQMLRPAELTKELLLSYFTFEVQDELRNSLTQLHIDSSTPLSKKEVEKLLKKQDGTEIHPTSGTFL